MKKLGLFFSLLLIFITISCEIGLGASIDTEAPAISIENPPADAKIREAFMIDGNWSDDGAISKLSIELKSNDSKISAKHTFEGTLNYEVKSSGGKGTWYALIDPIKESIKDGTYEATVTIVDSMGHKTSTNRSYTIDNTKPVIKIERPSSIKNAEDSLVESYGQYLTLTGEAYDDNDIATIKITFYDADIPTEGPWTTTLTGVSSKIDNDIAKFSKTFDINNIYSRMYGTDANGGTHKYYCTIETYDGTKRYPPKGQEKEDDDLGNPTNTYLLDDDLQDFNKENSALCEALKGKDQKFKVKDLYAIKAGNSNFTSDRAVSDEYLSKALEKINELFTNKSVSEGSLKLNPKNNPSFSVSGLELGEITNVENERALTVQLSKGLDGIKIDRDSLKVYLIPVMDPQGNTIENADKIYLSDDDSQYEKKGDGQFLATIRKKQDVNAPEKDLVYRTIYIIGVEGEDIEGNKMEASLDGSNKDYRIRLKAKNIPPELTITKPEDTIWYTKKGDSVVIEGTTSVPDGQPILELRKNGSKDSIWTYTVSESDLANDSEDDWIKYNFSVTIPDDTTGFAFSEEKTDKYVFEIVSTLEESSSSASKTIVYDIDPPTIQNYSLSSAYDAGLKDGIKTYYIDNRETPFTLTGIAKDNIEVGEVSLTLKDENGATLKLLTSKDAVWTFESNSETEAWTDLWKTWTDSVTAVISVKDKAGNETIAPKDFRIIFDTEAPVSKHCIDTSGKDLYFRIGEQSNDDIDSTSSLWNESLDKDVGGKYKSGTFGNKETIKIRGNFDDAGSGVKMIYYKLFTHEPTTAEIQSFLKTYESQALTESGVGYFSPLAVPETKRIFYADKSASGDLNDGTLGSKIVPAKKSDNSPDIQNGKFYTDIVSTYKTMITGFTAGHNHLALVAVDNVGHAAIDSVNSYCINVDTQAPETLSAEDVFTDGSADLQLAFTVNDKPDGQDAVSAGVNKVSVKMESVTETKAATLDTTLGSPTNGKWVVTIPVAELPSTSGSYAVSVTAVDGAGEGNSDTRTVCNVIVDKDPPEISNVKFEEVLTSSSKDVSQKNDYYYVNNTQGKQFRVSGVASDNRGVKSISLEVINTAENPATSLGKQKLDNPAQNWNFTVGDWASWTTGATLVITATDKAGLTSSQTLHIAFDTVAPTVNTEAITVPNPSQTESTMFKFEGAAGSLSDAASGLDKVEIAFTSAPASGSPVEPTAAQATVTPSSKGSWSSAIEFTNSAFTEVFNSQGTKYIWVRAYDKAGNASGWVSKSFVYDTETPTISFTATTENKNPAVDSFRNAEFKLEVAVADSYGIKSVNVNYGSPATTRPLTVNSDGKYEATFVVGSENADEDNYLADGTYSFEVVVTDSAYKTNKVTRNFSIDTTKPSITQLKLNNAVIAVDTDTSSKWYKTQTIPLFVIPTYTTGGSGIASVEYATLTASQEANETTLADSNWTPLSSQSTGYSGSAIFSGNGTGQKLYIRIKDKAGNVNYFKQNNAHISINIDTTAPGITPPENNIFYTNGSGNVITLSGTANDAESGVNSVVITIDGISEFEREITSFTGTDNNVWSTEIEASTFAESESGNYTIYAQASNAAGLTNRISIGSLIVDKQAPTITIANQNANTDWEHSLTSDSYTFKVTVTDEAGSGVANISYAYTNSATAPEAGSSEWTTENFADGEKYIQKDNLQEGVFYLHVKATDKAGNSSAPVTRTVYIDKTAPVLTANYYQKGTGDLSSAMGAVYVTSNSTITLYGNYLDSHSGVKQLKFKLGTDEVTPTVSYATESFTTAQGASALTYGDYSSAAKAWKAVYTATADGNLTVEGENLAGLKTSTTALNITVDGEAPAIANVKLEEVTGDVTTSAYSKNSTYYVNNSSSDKSFKISGIATDDVGVAKISLAVTNTAETNPADALEVHEINNPTNSNWNFTISGINEWTTGANATVTVTDKAGRVTTQSLNIIFDTEIPGYTANSLKVGNAAWNEASYYRDTTLKMSGTFTETKSGMDVVYYYVQYPGRSGTVPTDLTTTDSDDNLVADGVANFKANSNDFNFTVENYTNNTQTLANTLYIQAVDKVGNKSARTSYVINIDTTAPELQTLYYQIGEGSLKTLSGTLYVNGTSAVTLYGSYKDFESGVNPLAFTLGGTAVSPTVTYSTGTPAAGNTADETAANVAGLTYGTYAAASKKQYTYWKAVYTPTTGGKIGISGSNGTHVEDTNIGTISDSPCTITIDGTTPNLQNIRLIIDESNDKDAYKKTVSNATRYYINNSTNTSLVISGVATDNIGVEKVELSIPGTGTTAGTSADYSNAGTASEWKFENINLSAVAQNSNNDEPDATATITVTDVAGNTYSSPLNIFFDTTGPIGIHQQDAESNDLYFRLGDDDNDSGSDALNTDVGKMYSEQTYGNASTIKIRGKINDSESGVKLIYYHVFDKPICLDPSVADTVEPTPKTVSEVDYYAFRNEAKLRDYVIAHSTGYFAPLSSAQTKRVYYKVNATTQAYLDVDSTYYETLSGFDNSINYLVIAAEDNVGNKGLDTATVAPGYSKINVDNTPPSLSLTLAEGQEAIFYSNKSTELSFSGTATDDLSGIKSITFNVNGHVINTTENDYGKVEITNVTGSTVSKNWSLIVKPAALPDSGTVSVMGTVTDNAGSGNSQTAPACTIIMDTTPPKVTINDLSDADTTAEGTQINGVISISGTASDANGLATTPDMILYYTTFATLAAATTAPDAADVIATATSEKTAANSWLKIGTASHNSPWTFSNIDTSTLEIANQATTTVYFMVAAKDSSGNVGYSYQYNSEGEKVARKAYIVDQDSDRPIITLTGPSSLEELSDGAVNWESRTISGTVSDDDNNITYIGYYVGDEISYTATDYTELTIRNGVWKFNLSADGSQKVFFKVTAGGKDYYANTSTTYSNATVYDSENSRGTYKLTDGTNYFGTRPANGTTTTATSLALVIDTTPPDVETPEYSVDNGVTWQTGVGAQTFGGTLRNNIQIRQSGWDKNTVKSMTVKVIEIIDGNDSETPKFSGTYNYNTTAAEALPANTNNRSYTRFTSAAFDTTGWKSSGDNADGHKYAYRIETVISDGIKETLTKLDLTVDNTLPKVTFSGPKEGIYSGDITAYGAANEKCKISYTISTDGVNKPSSTAGQTLTSWTGYTLNGEQRTATEGTIANVAVPAYSVIPNADLAWTINFDDNTNDTEHAHSAKLKDYVKNLGIIGATENLSSFTKLVNFYLWIKAEDVVGNTEEYSHLICVDPNGDKPTVSISNPEEPNATTGNAASLGGTIKLSGTAEDSNGSVESVWVQLLSAKNGTGYGDVSVTNNTITNFEPTTKDFDFWKTKGYTVAKMKPETDGTHKAWTGTTTSPGTLSAGETVSDYGIQATFSGTSWSLKINSAGEFNPSGDTVNDMAVRVYACDNEKNLSYSVTRYFKIDKNTPVISDVVLRQYAASDTTFAKPTASQDVRAGMYVKGNWYLEFNVTDDAGIESIEFDGITDPQKQIGASNISGTTASKKVRFAISSATGNEFKRTIKASDNSTPSNTGTYDIEIYFDNDAPKLLKDTAGDFDIAASVRQSNGFYKLYSKVNDESGSSKGSGIKAVGFYFMRRKAADEGLIYDPMQQRVAPISTKASNVTYADGLYWLDGKVNCSSDGSITLADGLSEKAAYVHAGSYIRLAGVMYKITSKSGTTVMIEEDHATGNDISAQIALALFVDNRKAEYEATTDKDDITGYYTSIKNTDGDSMIEELGGTETVSSWQGSIVSRNIPDGPIEIHYTAYDKSMNYAVGVVGNEPLDTYKNYTTKEVDELWTMNGTERVSLKTQELDGQYASYVYTYNEANPAYISNNAPRLTGVTVAIDYTGAGQYKTATKTTYYYKTEPRLINNEVQTKPIAVTDSLEISDKIENNGTVTGYKGVNTIKGKTWIIPEMVGGNGKLWYSYNIYGSETNGAKKTSVVKKSSGTNATYFANGSNDFDGYVHKAGGQDYVEAHSTAVIDDNGNITSGFIVHDTSVFTGTGSTGDATVDQPLWFDYTIYDSTEVKSDETSVAETTLASNQKATISIAMAVEVNDNLKPNVVFNDLYWNDKSDNSVYWLDDKAQGHVELRSDLVNGEGKIGGVYGMDDDKVSGIVKFTGYAWDNKCLSELKWAIVENEDDDEDEETVAYSEPVYKFGSGMQNGATFNISTGNWTSSATMAANHYTFEVSKLASDGAYHDKNGHKVKWTLTVDTAHITSVVAENLRVIVQATDNASTVHSSAITNAVATSNSTDIATYDKDSSRPTYKVDVVPYITGVDTKLSTNLKSSIRSAYSRTALGHYIALSDETIVVKGFNLGNTTIKPKYGSTELSFNNAGNISLPVRLMTTSGKVALTVNGLATLNNMNNNNACGSYKTETTQITESSEYADKNKYAYNRMPNQTSNNLLTDDVEVDIWQFDNDAAKPMSGELREPSMQINPVTGVVGLAFVSGPADISMADKTNNYSYTRWQNNFATFSNISFAIDALGNAHSTATGLDTNPKDKHAGRFSYFYSPWGTSLLGQADKEPYDNYSGIHAIRLESVSVPYIAGTIEDFTLDNPYIRYKYNNEKIVEKRNFYDVVANGDTIDSSINGVLTETRFSSPSLATAVHGTGDSAITAVYLAYYDSIQKQIRFRYSSAVPSAKGDKDDFVDNKGYFFGSTGVIQKPGEDAKVDSSVENYMEASTENFSLITGVDTQHGTPKTFGETSRMVEYNKTDADGNQYYKVSNKYSRVLSKDDENHTVQDQKKDAEKVELKIDATIRNKLHTQLQKRPALAEGETVVAYQRSNKWYWIVQPDGLIFYTTETANRADQGCMTHIATNIDPHAYIFTSPSDSPYIGRKLDPDENYVVYARVTASDIAEGENYKVAITKDADQAPYFWPSPQTVAKESIPIYSYDYCNAYDTGYTGYKYVAIDAKAGSDAAHDVVVAVWYDGTGLHYAYNDNPTSGLDNGTAGGWKGNKVIFTEGGEHCTVKIDPNGGVHIAAYADGSLRYAYLSSKDADYNEATDSVVVDSYTITGERIGLDVGLVDYTKPDGSTVSVVVPYITYYNGTARKPSLAKLVIPSNGTMNYKAQGTANDVFTGNWEITLVPTEAKPTSMYYDKMNIGLWKNAGKIVASTDSHFTVSGAENAQKTSADNTSSTTNGVIYGNGTANPILGYAIESTTGTCLETAQMK